MKLLSNLFACFFFISGAEAFPSGAGGCPAGGAAVAGIHLARATTEEGSLSQGGFSITVDGEAVNTGSSYTFRSGVDHVLKITGPTYKGVIFRIGGAGTSALTIPDGASDIQISSLCIANSASGVTHTDPSEKTSTEAILRVDGPTTGITLDVTVVIQNVAAKSEYYYSGFSMSATSNAPTPPTPAPAAAPTFAVDDSICGSTGLIAIAGSSTVEPVAQLWGAGYTRSCGNLVTIEGGGSSSGARRVCGDSSRGETKVPIGDMSRNWRATEASRKSDGFTLDCLIGDTDTDVIQIDVAIDGLSVASKLNGVGAAACIELLGGLTIPQLRWIFSDLSKSALVADGWDASSVPFEDGNDATHKWNELNFLCVDAEISISGADDESGTYEYFADTVFSADGETFREPYFNSAVDEDIVEFIEGNDNAIGYFGYAFFDENRNVFAVAPIQNSAGDLVAPTAETVGDGTYNPLARRIFMNLDKAELDLTRGIISYGFSAAGDADVSAVGYVPLPASEQTTMKDRVKKPAATGGGFCFPSESVVDVLGKGPVDMKQVKIGDKVLAADGEYEKIVSFGHRNEDATGEYLKMTTSSKAAIELTKDHMIFSGGKAFAADSFKVGDVIDMAHGQTEQVTKIQHVTREGAYAPFTESGAIVVNGVLASSYVAMQEGGSDMVTIGGIEIISHQLTAQISQAPHRIVCALNMALCEAETYNSEGVSNWVAGQYTAAKWIVKQNAVVMTIVLVPSVVVFGFVALVETLMKNWAMAVAVIGAYYALCRKGKKVA